MTEDSSTQIYFWHGARRWAGVPELRSPRKGKYEHGPGLYMSNHLSTAVTYSKNGGQLVLMGLDRNMGLLDKVALPLADIFEGIEVLPRVRSRSAIKKFLTSVSEERFFNGNIPLTFLLNELINFESLSGETGLAFARWLVSKGVDAVVENVSAEENYVVVFNPKIIQSHRVFDKSTAEKIGSFGLLSEQLGEKVTALKP